MKGSTQAALALGFGYLLGRRRKFRRAVIVGGALASGGMGALGSTAMQRGAKALGSSDTIGKVAPQLGGIADAVRGPLLAAGKTAALAVVSNRIEALSDSLQQRAETVRDPGASVATLGGALRGGRRRQERPAEADDDADYDDENAEYEDDEYEDEAEYDDRDLANGQDSDGRYASSGEDDALEADGELNEDEDVAEDDEEFTSPRNDDDDLVGDERPQRVRRPSSQRRSPEKSPVSRTRR